MKKLIHQYITTGLQLPEYQLNMLSNNQLKSYFNVRVRSNKLVGYEIIRLNEIDVGMVDKYLSNQQVELHLLFRRSENKEKICDIVLNSESFITNLTKDNLILLLRNTKEPKMVMKRLGSVGQEKIAKLDKSGVLYILSGSHSENIMEVLGKTGEEVIGNLDEHGIGTLLAQSDTKLEYAYKVLLSNDKLVSNLNYDGLRYLLGYLHGEDKGLSTTFINNVFNVLISNERFMENIDSKDMMGNTMINLLVKYAIEPEMVLNKLGDKGVEFLSRLRTGGITDLLLGTPKPVELIKALGNDGERYMSNLDVEDTRNLWRVARRNNKEIEVINLLLSNSTYLNNLDGFMVSEILTYGRIAYNNNPEKEDMVKSILIKHGHGKNLDLLDDIGMS